MPGMDRFLALAGPGMFGASWWPLILTYILTFLVCGIPFGKIFARLLGKIDLQKVGSGNIGTTNALRAGGPKVAIPTLICDVFKGVLGVNAAVSSSRTWSASSRRRTRPQRWRRHR